METRAQQNNIILTSSKMWFSLILKKITKIKLYENFIKLRNNDVFDTEFNSS